MLPLWALTIGFALVAAVLAVDVGLLLGERVQARQAADFAALAAAQDLPNGPADPDTLAKFVDAEATGSSYAEGNGYSASDADVQVAVTTQYGGNYNEVEVLVSRERSWLIGRLFGIGNADVAGRAVARRTEWSGPSRMRCSR